MLTAGGDGMAGSRLLSGGWVPGRSRLPRRWLAAGVGIACAAAATGTALLAGAGQAQAAVPDRWGFAYVSAPAVPGVPDLAHQAGSWPAPFVVHTKPGVVGQVFVRLPKIASKRGVVHVTAVADGRPVWCQAQKWGPAGVDEVVAVRCYRASAGPAVPVFSQFTIAFATSSKGPFPPGRGYGYVHFRPGSGIVTRFNSSGGVNTVTPGAPGVWLVTMPGLGTPARAGGVQVTAVNPSVPAKCELGGWASSPGRQRFLVRCFNGMSTPLKTGWTLTYQRRRAITGGQPGHYAYTMDNKPLLPGPYVPAPPGINVNSAGGVNNIRSAGTGLRLVQLPRVGAKPDNVVITGFKVGAGFCNLITVWATIGVPASVLVRDVNCFNAVGAPTSEPSLISYMSKH